MFHHSILVFCFPEKNIHSRDLCWMCPYRTNLNAKLHITLHTQTESILWMLQPLGTPTDGSCPKHLEHFASRNPHAPGELLGRWKGFAHGLGLFALFKPPETLLSYWILLVLLLHFKGAFFPFSFGCSLAQKVPDRRWEKSGCSLKCTR